MVWVLIILALLLVLFIWLEVKHKRIKSNCVLFVSGAPKTGKSTLSVYLCIRKYKFRRVIWNISNFFLKLFKKELLEEPYLYSNIPIKIKKGYVPLTREHIKREKRIHARSVVYLGEFSLVANSRLGQKNGVKNGVDYDLLNEELLLFTKLFGHEVKGGYMVVDSQTISDCHYAIKRCLSEYVYVHHNLKLLFHCILWVKECTYSEDSSTQQVVLDDVENNLQWLIVPKRVWKQFDYRCYSVLTDDLPSDDTSIDGDDIDSLKADDIVSFTDYRTLESYRKRKEKKENEIQKE